MADQPLADEQVADARLPTPFAEFRLQVYEAEDGKEHLAVTLGSLAGDPPPPRVIHRCQLSFPDVIGTPAVRVLDGDQDDGVHTVVADRPVGVTVWGFDRYVSYAYVAGLNLEPIPR